MSDLARRVAALEQRQHGDRCHRCGGLHGFAWIRAVAQGTAQEVQACRCECCLYLIALAEFGGGA
jgi:hypothetical protein